MNISKEYPIHFWCFLQLLEVFGVGTAVVVCPVAEIHYNDNGAETVVRVPTTNQSDALHQRLCDAILGIQYGRVPHPWAVEIE